MESNIKATMNTGAAALRFGRTPTSITMNETMLIMRLTMEKVEFRIFTGLTPASRFAFSIRS